MAVLWPLEKVKMSEYRISNAVQVITLTEENSPAFRRCLGVEPKDRQTVHVSIEKVLLDALDAGNLGRGCLSDLVNQGLNLALVQAGLL